MEFTRVSAPGELDYPLDVAKQLIQVEQFEAVEGNVKGVMLGVLGARAPLYLQGGIETYCRTVYPHLVSQGLAVSVFTRHCYAPNYETSNGIEYIPVRTLKNRSFETVLHTPMALIWAKFRGCQVVHFHAIGPAMYVPMARLLGLKVIVRHVGRCYERKKWGAIARGWLRGAEWMAGRFAHVVTFLSQASEEEFRENLKPRCRTVVIENSVPAPVYPESSSEVDRLALTPGKYFIYTGRLVPEKSIETLIKAFDKMKVASSGWKVVIAGAVDYEGQYGKDLLKLSEEVDGIVLAGEVFGDELKQLYANAGVFALPSLHEGMSFSLLEAMSYGLPCIVSDIPANRAVNLPDHHYAIPGNVEDFVRAFNQVMEIWTSEESCELARRTSERFGLSRLVHNLLSEIAYCCSNFQIADPE